MVRITTTDATVSELSDLCPLNYSGLQTQTPTNRNSRLSFNTFYFATADTQKDSGLQIELIMDTGIPCSISNLRNFWEIRQLQHPITIQKSSKITKTYLGQTVPMIGLATINFSYNPDGQFIFPLTVWITDMET